MWLLSHSGWAAFLLRLNSSQIFFFDYPGNLAWEGNIEEVKITCNNEWHNHTTQLERDESHLTVFSREIQMLFPGLMEWKINKSGEWWQCIVVSCHIAMVAAILAEGVPILAPSQSQGIANRYTFLLDMQLIIGGPWITLSGSKMEDVGNLWGRIRINKKIRVVS